jgi:putative pyruvate formate lyase activating enzyme
MVEPAYLTLARTGELARRVTALDQLLTACRVCPWACGVDRSAGETKVCGAAFAPLVASFAPHFGEEPPLSGAHLPPGEARGSGTIFLGRCNLRCVFCQNAQISQEFDVARSGGALTCEALAGIALELQARGCHNINFVSPTHFAPQVVRAVALAAERGLSVPLVYNTNGYDSVETLQLLDGVFDIYLPDLKYADDDIALEYSQAARYVERARAAVAEMARQVGQDLVLDDRGVVRRGLIIRLLILPNDLAGLRGTLRWIRETIGPRVTLSVMSQYYPANKVHGGRYPLLARPISEAEHDEVLAWLEEFGFENGWIQPYERRAADYYRPDFRDPKKPFKDADDFR